MTNADLIEQNELLRQQLALLSAPACRGNPQHRPACTECGYCARCHVTNYGRLANGDDASGHNFTTEPRP